MWALWLEESNMEHTECVADTEVALIELSKIANIPYTTAEFLSFEEKFSDSGKDEDFYSLKGKELEISVQLEKHEGYFFVTIIGGGSCFEKAKYYLINCTGY